MGCVWYQPPYPGPVPWPHICLFHCFTYGVGCGISPRGRMVSRYFFIDDEMETKRKRRNTDGKSEQTKEPNDAVQQQLMSVRMSVSSLRWQQKCVGNVGTEGVCGLNKYFRSSSSVNHSLEKIMKIRFCPILYPAGFIVLSYYFAS